MAVRSESSRQAILDATTSLLDPRRPGALTLQKLSIERIAREAGVSKTTIYRWWPSKAAVVIDTFLDDHVARTPARSDLPAMDALREHLSSVATIYSGHEGELMAQLIAECQYDPETMAEFKRRFYDQRLQTAVSLIERATAEGGIRSDIPAVTIAQLIYAPLYFRLLFQEQGLNGDAAVDILEMALEGIRPQEQGKSG